MNSNNITDGELEVLETLWEKGEPVFFGELLECFNARTKKEWKKQTMNTFLFRMQKKNLVEAIGGSRYKRYMPLISKDEYTKNAAKAFLDRNYCGSFVEMFSALSGGKKLDKREMEELRKMLEEWEKE